MCSNEIRFGEAFSFKPWNRGFSRTVRPRVTGRPIGLIGTAETENLGKKHPWRTTLGSGVTTVTSARATPRPHRVRRPRCVLPLERSHWHSSSRFSWRFPRPPGASALTRARRPPRAPTTPLTVFRGCARPLRQTRRRRPDAPRSPRRRHGRRLHRRRSRGRRLRRRQRHRADRTEGGETPDNTLGRWWWGGWYGWKGWWGYYTYPYYTSYWYAPHPLSRPPYFIPPRTFDSCLSTPPASTLVPASSRSGYWNYGYGYHKSADAKAPESVNEMTAADAEARAKRVSRARGPRARGARASTRRASSERTDVASSCVEWLGVDDAALAAAPSNVAVRDDACCWPSGRALAASAGCVAEDGGACCVPDSERLEEC